MSEEGEDRIEQAAIVAHQIKSPVATLQTILRTLLGGFAGELDERQRGLVQSADRKCTEAMETIQGLLALADASAQASGDARADLVSVVWEVCQRYESAAVEKQIRLTNSFELDEAWVAARPAALQEGVVVLIDNAIKYTPDGGHVEVTLAKDEEGRARLRVADSGIGVPEDQWGQLFQPFFRARNAKELVRSGTGLGLAFLKAVARAADGEVGVDHSELGGTAFALTMPLAEGPGAEAQQAAAREPSFRAIVIGGVAAGPKIASKIMRMKPDASVTIIERGRVLSYAGCALPYYISGRVSDQQQLLSTPEGVVRGPEYFERVKDVRVMHRTEALEIDRTNKRVRVRDLITGKESWLPYDKLALATGALPVVPDIPGVGLANVFTLHGMESAEGVRSFVSAAHAVDVTIVGGGLIGVAMTESLVEAGCRVTLVELAPQLLRRFDWEIAQHVHRHFESHGVRVVVRTRVTAFEGEGKVQRVVTQEASWPTDCVILGVGVRPNSKLAAEAGLEVRRNGGIMVDEHMRTSDPDIYAAGDCIECRDVVTGRYFYEPMGGVATRQGRVVAESICGGDVEFPGVLGTAICKVFEQTVARTGLTERLALELGYHVVTALVPALDRAHYMPDARLVMLKLIADGESRRLLGMQAVGAGEVAKRMDIAVTAITAGMTVDGISNLDLCYAPAYSTALDNIHAACNVMKNKIDGAMTGISPVDVRAMLDGGVQLVFLDVRTHSEFGKLRLEPCIHIPLPLLRARLGELPRDRTIIVYSLTSMTAYEASIILRAHGFEDVKVLDGGVLMWPYD